MAVKVEIPYTRSLESPLDLKATLAYFSNLERSIPENFPGLVRFDPVSADTYHWVFQKVSYGGHDIGIDFVTKFDVSGNTISIAPAPSPGGGRLSGQWRFAEKGTGTEVTFDVKLELELPIPFFLKAMATPLTQKEITKLFDRYVANATKHLVA